MTHPFGSIRDHVVQKSRVSKLFGHACGGRISRASGGAVRAESDSEYATDGEIAHDPVHKRGAKDDRREGLLKRGGKVEGKRAKHRADRPKRASGGRVAGKKGSTTVNVIIAGGNKPSMPPPMPMAGAPMAPPRPAPPMPGPPPGPPAGLGAGPGGPPPGMPMRARGGRLGVRGQGPGKAAKDSASWLEGIRNGTKVQPNESGKIDTADIGRPKPVTYRTGGAVKGVSVAIKPGAPIGGVHRDDASKSIAPIRKSSVKVSQASLPTKDTFHEMGGARSGEERLRKEKTMGRHGGAA